MSNKQEDKYIIIKGLDYYGSDISYSNIYDVNILMDMCENNKNIIGFNTHGCLKKFININELGCYPHFKASDALYVHKERYYNIFMSYKKFKSDIINLKQNIEQELLNNNDIPNIYHFIYLDGGQPFRINDYIAIKSAHIIQQPDCIFLYTDKEPINNIWWDRVKKYARIVLVTVPQIMNNNIVPYFQHKADIMRLYILHEIGGIYMDLDIISLNSLNNLRDKSIVMGKETNDKLCNCVIMAKPKTKFIEKWIKKYETMYGTTDLCWWAGLSTIIPKQLSTDFKDEIYELKGEQIMPFMFNDFSIFYTNDYSNLYTNSYTVHLWATECNKQKLLPDTLDYFNGDNKFIYMFKKYIEEYM
jgi:hypothetical protein